MDEAREAVLARIRVALGDEARTEPAAIAWERIARGYRRRAAGSQAEVMALLEERLRDYDAVVERVTAAELPAAMDRALGEIAGDVLVVAGFAAGWLPATRPVKWDEGLTARQLDGFSTVLTGATLAIAETGGWAGTAGGDAGAGCAPVRSAGEGCGGDGARGDRTPGKYGDAADDVCFGTFGDG